MSAFNARHARANESDTEVTRIDGETVEYDPDTGEIRRLTATTVGTPGPAPRTDSVTPDSS